MPATTARGRTRARVIRELTIGIGAMALACLVTIPQFVANGSDVTTWLRVGRYAPSRPYVERSFPNPTLTEDYGHDGQQFYVLSSAFPDLRSAAPFVDRVGYRAHRIVFIALAAPFPDGPARVWAMFAINLLAIGAAALALARLAERLKAPPAIGLVAGLTPALVESLQGSLADGLAFALALWGVVLWRRRLGWAVLLFALAALTRETTLVAPLACAIVGDNRVRLRMVIPFATTVGWAALCALWLPSSSVVKNPNALSDLGEALSWPLTAWFSLGFGQDGVIAAIGFLVLSVVATWLLARSALPELAWWLAFDAALIILSTPAVIERPLNLARVAPLALPGIVLAFFARRAEHVTTKPVTALP